MSQTTVTMKGNPVPLTGSLPAVGDKAPEYTLVGTNLAPVTPPAGKTVLSVFPSVDTPTCAASVRRFNQEASSREGVTVLCVSKDLPFAMARFCGAEGLDNVVCGSAFRSDFGHAYGLDFAAGPLEGLLARAIVVVDADGNVVHTELVPEVGDEPDYAAALAAVDAL